MSRNYPLSDQNYSGFSFFWVLLLPSSVSVSPDLLKRGLFAASWRRTRWKALDEIYKIHTLLHRSGFKISAENRQHFLRLNIEFPIFFHFLCRINNFAFFLRNFYEILSGFRDKFQEGVTCVAFFNQKATHVAF